MSKVMKWAAAVSVAATFLFSILYAHLRSAFLLPFAITFATVSYHLCVRLLIGTLYHSLMKNRADYRRAWYQLHSWERKIYDRLQVKRWKDKMPTYDMAAFDPRIHSWDEIAQAMCQSELVHETNVIFSFLPLLAAIWAGSLPVFLITSVLSACYDLLFVIMQRYNRPRIIRLTQRQASKKTV